MSRELIAYGINVTLASIGTSTHAMFGVSLSAFAVSRMFYPQGASIFMSGVSTATLSDMLLVPSGWTEINGPAPLYFRSAGASGGINMLTNLSQGYTGSAIPTP